MLQVLRYPELKVMPRAARGKARNPFSSSGLRRFDMKPMFVLMAVAGREPRWRLLQANEQYQRQAHAGRYQPICAGREEGWRWFD
jgi:hypothetical protein